MNEIIKNTPTRENCGDTKSYIEMATMDHNRYVNLYVYGNDANPKAMIGASFSMMIALRDKLNRMYPQTVVSTTGPAPEYVLIVKKDGKYAPAETPRIYSSESQALSVAHNMADRNPGEEFVVFKTLAKVNVPPPVKPSVVRYA